MNDVAGGYGQGVPPGDAASVRGWLMRFMRRRIDNDSEAEDLVQEVFVRIAARDSSEPVEHLGAYVMRTAQSVIADRSRRWRSRRGDLHIPFEAEAHGGEEIDPERVFTGREDLRAATAALLSLPERTRNVFILRRLEGHRHREIATHLGISVSAVEKHMVRAIQHIVKRMGQGLDS
jgi:RNA polymerase sigma-70 factor (ECF subfamily)